MQIFRAVAISARVDFFCSLPIRAQQSQSVFLECMKTYLDDGDGYAWAGGKASLKFGGRRGGGREGYKREREGGKATSEGAREGLSSLVSLLRQWSVLEYIFLSCTAVVCTCVRFCGTAEAG